MLRWRTKCAALARRSGLVVVTGGRTAAGNLILSSSAVDVRGAPRSAAQPRPGTAPARGRAGRRCAGAGSGSRLAGTHLDLEPAAAAAPRRRDRARARRVLASRPLVRRDRRRGDINDEPGSATWVALDRRPDRRVRRGRRGRRHTFTAANPRRRLDGVFVGGAVTAVAATVLDDRGRDQRAATTGPSWSNWSSVEVERRATVTSFRGSRRRRRPRRVAARSFITSMPAPSRMPPMPVRKVRSTPRPSQSPAAKTKIDSAISRIAPTVVADSRGSGGGGGGTKCSSSSASPAGGGLMRARQSASSRLRSRSAERIAATVSTCQSATRAWNSESVSRPCSRSGADTARRRRVVSAAASAACPRRPATRSCGRRRVPSPRRTAAAGAGSAVGSR